MPEYLVIATEDSVTEDDVQKNVVIIEAETPEEAKYLYIKKIGIHKDAFLKHVYEQSMTWSYAAKFWGKLYDFDNWGEPLYDEDKIHVMFKDMVREFFGEHQDWAVMFIKYTFDEKTEIEFPEEMLTFMLLREQNWSPYIIVPLDDLRLK